ncbi:glycosyltransferase family 39 protein [Dictyobacter aurantiacus]|uniref:ArnT-like N-terminal domain-containing protein n=1 Tax=Dictyobacter aurantiacus TaxID=1936993 RepID=A0A401ZSS5_9CHLR|nr:glycosyltransferase family 39 protein [Dictyobacter aurantiacus]GCE09913.1 hypothetical protein KDAU_72420 [Dictyobacter aurantiacus]
MKRMVLIEKPATLQLTKRLIDWQPWMLGLLSYLGLLLRVYGLNWDQGKLFHPDEPFIVSHALRVAWPTSVPQFFDPLQSPLNPHFFAYGSFPIYLLALLGHTIAFFFPDFFTYTNLNLAGRCVSAIMDSGTILITGLLAYRLCLSDRYVVLSPRAVSIVAAMLVAFSPLQVQQSHYCTVDAMLLFLVTLTLLGCVTLVETRTPLRVALLIGCGYGLALATKVSAAPLAVPVGIALLLRWRRERRATVPMALAMVILATCLTFMLSMPYALLDWRNFLQQVIDQGNMSTGKALMPYTIQFEDTIPYLYEIQNIFLWGLGPMLALSAGGGLLWLTWRTMKMRAGCWLIMLSWILVYGGMAGGLYVKYVRYMLPLYSALIVIAAASLAAFTTIRMSRRTSTDRAHVAIPAYTLIGLVLLTTIFQGLAMINIYSQPSTLIQASRWMFTHLTYSSHIIYEQGDVIIPVAIDNHNPQQDFHLAVSGLDMYSYDNPAKIRALTAALANSDVLVLTSDRWDQPATRLLQYYPVTSHYYHMLFQGRLGFRLAARFENHPHLLGITLNDSDSDPSFSIFDHPTVRIFVRDPSLRYSASELYRRMLQGAPPMPFS